MKRLLQQRNNLLVAIRQGLLALVFSLASIPSIAPAAPIITNAPEYEVKAAFLFKFGAYVDWPPDTFPTPTAPFVIGIVGADPFGAAIDRIVTSHVIGNRTAVVVRAQRIDQIGEAHILFISQSEKGSMGPILAHLRGKKVLTIAEFANPIIIIHLVTENDRVQFDINLDRANQVGIKLSSKLLSVARTVNGK